jgi:RND family efflux transporter MFP subunit
MPARRNLWAPAGVLALAGLLSAFLILSRPGPETDPPDEPGPAPVRVVTIVAGEETARVRASGRVTGRYSIQIVSQVSGTIESTAPGYRQGARVEAGDPLVQIDDIQGRAALSEASSAQASALQQLAQERGLAEQARREWRDLGNASANSLFLREPQLRAAEARVEAAQSAYQRAQQDLRHARVQAPFTGVIEAVLADLGQYVGIGTPLARLVSTDQLHLEASLTLRQIDSLGWRTSTPLPATTVGELLLGEDASASIPLSFGHISGQMDPDTQMISLVLDIPTDTSIPRLTPGQFVSLRLLGTPVQDASWIPASSIHERNLVLRVVEGSLEQLQVEVLADEPGQVLVRGLDSGDLLVTERPLWVFPGQRVTPLPAP